MSALFNRLVERRNAAQPFTDAVVDATQAAVAGGQGYAASAAATAALEVAAGLWARAFQGASVTPMNMRTAPLTAAIRGHVGRWLLRRGEAVLLIEWAPSGLSVRPAASWDISGGASEASWTYRLDLFGAPRNETRRAPAAGVLHPRYAFDPGTPWIGQSPLSWAARTGGILGRIEQMIAAEAAGRSGYLYAAQHVHQPDAYRNAQTDAGRLFAQFDGGTFAAPGYMAGADNDLKTPVRIGLNPPSEVRLLRAEVTDAVLAACGVPPSLARVGEATGIREAWRLFLAGTIEPVGAAVAEHFAERLDEPALRIDFRPLLGLDVRARTFSSLAASGEGLPSAQAAEIAGIAA